MFSYASLTKNLNIANCTNHEVTLFNPQFLTEDRRNNTCFFYHQNDIESAKIESFPQLKPLSVREFQNDFVSESNGIKFFQPPAYYCTIDDLSNYYNYDIVIVSGKYANMAMLKIQNPDFLDRLFTPCKLVYDKNPKIYNDAVIKGCIGLQKVSYPYNLSQYASMIDNGFNPSKISMFLTRDMYSKHPNRYAISQQSNEEFSLNTVNIFLSKFGFTPVQTLLL